MSTKPKPLTVLFCCCLILLLVGATVAQPVETNEIPNECRKPMVMGYCRAKVPRYYFDYRHKKCRLFYFGGCAGNENNFKTIEECNELCY